MSLLASRTSTVFRLVQLQTTTYCRVHFEGGEESGRYLIMICPEETPRNAIILRCLQFLFTVVTPENLIFAERPKIMFRAHVQLSMYVGNAMA